MTITSVIARRAHEKAAKSNRVPSNPEVVRKARLRKRNKLKQGLSSARIKHLASIAADLIDDLENWLPTVKDQKLFRETLVRDVLGVQLKKDGLI